jgi:hypothetical protein
MDRLKRAVDSNAVDVLDENKKLREEINALKSVKNRSRSPRSATDLRSENKSQVSTELVKFKKDNETLYA